MATKTETVQPLRLDPSIRDLFVAHVDAIFADTPQESDQAAARRNKLMAALDTEQRSYVDVIARGMARAFS